MEILLFYTQEEVRKGLKFQVEALVGGEVLECSGISEALNFLLEDREIDMLICEDHESITRLFKYMASVNSQIPIVIISDEVQMDAFSDLKVLDSLKNEEIVEKLPGIIESAKKEGLIPSSGYPKEYYRIPAELLVRVVPLKGDVYLRLSNIKFVKMFKEGDTFDKDDFQKYVNKKKISHFYLKSEAVGEFLSNVTQDLSQMLNASQVNFEEAVAVTENIQETVHELGDRLGFTPEVQHIAKQNVDLALKAIGTNPTLSGLISRVKEEPKKYIYSHSIMVAHVSCSIAKLLEWTSKSTFYKLTLAAFFHDITLKNHELAKINSLSGLEKNEKRFTAEELEAFKKHPIKASEVIRHFNEIPADVDTIIFQHHERPDGSGFPRGVSDKYISPLSAVFIVAHEFVRFYLNKSQQPNLEAFVDFYKDRYTSGMFRKILNKIQTDRLNKKRKNKAAA